jgi:UDP-N-acetylglucosamine 4,6-dehydratase
MITEDDARTTVELEDRYVIEPALAWWDWEGYKQVGTRVREGFRYSSDLNEKWMTADELRAILSTG